ncbi:hypothetical protein [Microbulbifer marinus]|uniref:Uncharacterized protein n=1 Tax=Microbulbifer marinus TaxID=658218 RepID=A0A1H3YN93_9GAMM|nr:hypothetical protein [Microbulbifer marinus]SEA12963.1 hypothetical protein SAMN05216562_1875 [Microbulbifer marinus]
MNNLATIVSIVLCLFVGNAYAQSQMPAPTSAGPNMNMLVPMLKAQLEALGNPELLEAQAKYFRELYLSLKKQGFTEEQAMQIVVALASSRNSK